MRSIFPRRRLTAAELSLIPEAFFRLMISRIRVSTLNAGSYMPEQTGAETDSKYAVLDSGYLAIARVINGLASRTPWRSTCLVKVLAAHKMLKMRGIEHKLHFGVRKSAGEELEAHVWLSAGGRVIIGKESLNGFSELATFNE